MVDWPPRLNYRSHHPLHPHEARSFDQHTGHLRQALQHSGNQRVNAVKMLRCYAIDSSMLA
jgi:hypothetical protein